MHNGTAIKYIIPFQPAACEGKFAQFMILSEESFGDGNYEDGNYSTVGEGEGVRRRGGNMYISVICPPLRNYEGM